MYCYTEREEKEWQKALAREARREDDQNTTTSQSYHFSESDFPSLPEPGPSPRMVKIVASKKTIPVEHNKKDIESKPIISSEPKVTKTKEGENKKKREKAAKAVKGMLSLLLFFLLNFLCRPTFGGGPRSEH